MSTSVTSLSANLSLSKVSMTRDKLMHELPKYSSALCVAVLVFFLQKTIKHEIPDARFLFFYPTVFASAWLFGMGPALAVLFFAAFSVGAVFLPDGISPLEYSELLRLGIFVFNASFVVWIIHQHQKNEVKLEEREERLRFATEFSNIGIWELDLVTGKTTTGAQHSKFFGQHDYQENGSLQSLLSSIHSDDQERVSESIEKAITSGELNVEFRMLWPDQTLHWLLILGKCVYDKQGNPSSLLGTVREITDKKESEQTLREALFYRDEFLSIASHELKTPLTSLRLQSQMFMRSVKRKDPKAYSPERIDRLVNEADRQVGRLVRLVDDMLDISRIRTGKLSICKEKVDLGLLVKDVVERIRPQFSDSGRASPSIELIHEVLVECDRMRMEQVLTNILSNAYRYGKGLPIKVRMKLNSSHVEVSVTDSGIGISPDNHEKIFSRFQRAVPASEVSGLGLGLYIARQIMDAHQGTIRVESELNKGSTFHIQLPLFEEVGT